MIAAVASTVTAAVLVWRTSGESRQCIRVWPRDQRVDGRRGQVGLAVGGIASVVPCKPLRVEGVQADGFLNHEDLIQPGSIHTTPHQSA